jgi:hypothetical protein
MKKLLLLYSLSLALSAKAQVLVDSNNIWNIVEGSFWTGPDRTTETYRFFEDTIINGKTYKKLYVSTESSLTNWNYDGDALREDSSKKVYIILDGGVEQLLYDFNLNVNDSFNLCGPWGQAEAVTSIDSVVLLNGEKRKRIKFGNSYPPMEWIEGIGNLSLFTESGVCFTDVNFWLNCFAENNTLKYKDNANGFTSCLYYYQKLYVTLSPNPFHGAATLEIRNGELGIKNLELKIYDVMGRVVHEQIVNRNSEIVNRDGLPDGLYFYQLRTNDYELIGTGKFVIN